VEESLPADEAALVRAVRDGDVGAFQALYQAHVRTVEAVIARHIHDRQLVADGVQEAFARALQRLDTLQQPDRFRPWLLSIARNVAIDLRRVGGRTYYLSDEAADQLPARGIGPAEAAELAELSRLVAGGVAGLSPRDAVALALTTRLGFDTEDVAAALNLRPGAARVLLHRARRRLGDALRLQLLVKRQGAGCPEFLLALDGDDTVGAARHIQDCLDCRDAADREVNLYAAVAPRPRPLPERHRSSRTVSLRAH
jgi:RNA polymerase sigma-70 factor (ECF subfamily)